MPNRLALKQGHYYHLRNFGADGRLLFRVTADRERFLQLLYLCNSSSAVVVRDIRDKHRLFGKQRGNSLTAIGAYVVLPDSFELVIYEHAQGGTSRFMQKLATGYSMYFNHQYGRSGRIFAGSYRARELVNQSDVVTAIAGVHLASLSRVEPNWQEEGIADLLTAERHLAHYAYSSYIDYTKKGSAPIFSQNIGPSVSSAISALRAQATIIDFSRFTQAHIALSRNSFMSHLGVWFV